MGKTLDSSDSLWQYLEAYYRMDWGTGTKAYDYSSNLNHGTLNNGPVWIESYSWDKGLFAHYKLNGNTRDSNGNTIGQSIGTEFSEDRHGYTKGTAKFTGNGWINLNKTSSKESATSLGLPKKDITLSAWVNPQSFGTWIALVGFFQDNGADENGWGLGLWSDKRYYFAVSGTTNNRLKYLFSNETRNTNQWAHLVGTYDGSTMKFYLDGTLSSQSNVVSGNIKYKDSWFALGSYKDDNEDFRINGKLDDVRVYNRVLFADEVSRLHNYEKLDPFKDGLVAHYPFNGNANDESGNGKNAIVTGSTLSKDRFDQSNKAYSFDGNDHIYSNLKISEDNTFSLNFWLKDDSTTNTYRRWLTTTSGGFQSNTITVREQSSGQMTIYAGQY
ncbi:MAG: LamG domain-containing protein, partial [Candidatus Neomarinimicrobiota bacterium]|nr:LamG domain-containing protein [Candidatus Neomarinimicrobiota bacterium]